METDDTIHTLNALIETSKDGEYGFRASAEQMHDPHVRQLFMKRADGCAQAARELQMIVVRLGGKALDGGTAAGALHRGWVAVKATLSSYTDLQVLEETERGEEKALRSYEKALATPMPDAVRDVVMQHWEGTRRNHDEVCTLRERAGARKPRS